MLSIPPARTLVVLVLQFQKQPTGEGELLTWETGYQAVELFPVYDQLTPATLFVSAQIGIEVRFMNTPLLTHLPTRQQTSPEQPAHRVQVQMQVPGSLLGTQDYIRLHASTPTLTA